MKDLDNILKFENIEKTNNQIKRLFLRNNKKEYETIKTIIFKDFNIYLENQINAKIKEKILSIISSHFNKQ